MHLPAIVYSFFVYTYLAIKLDSVSASSKRIACLALFPRRYSKTCFGYFILSSRGGPHQLCLVPVSETTRTDTPPRCSTEAWRPPGWLSSLLPSPRRPSCVWLQIPGPFPAPSPALQPPAPIHEARQSGSVVSRAAWTLTTTTTACFVNANTNGTCHQSYLLPM